MIDLEDRTVLAQDIDTARRNGARLERACAEAGITVRTLQRWKRNGGLVAGDRRLGDFRRPAAAGGDTRQRHRFPRAEGGRAERHRLAREAGRERLERRDPSLEAVCRHRAILVQGRVKPAPIF